MSSPVIAPEQLSALPPEIRAVIVALVALYEGRIGALEAELAATQSELAAAKAQLAATQAELAQARKCSATLSKPPPSDLVKPPKPPTPTGARRKRGGQPGHPRHERPPCGPDEIDRVECHRLQCCPHCGGPLEQGDMPVRVQQQVEVVARPIEVIEHRSYVCRCGRCRQDFAAPLPREIQAAGVAGPRLTALVGYLKGAGHCSFRTIQTFLRDVLTVSLSTGYVRKLCGKVAESLGMAYQELRSALPTQPRLNIDETGHKENGDALWTWCFRAPRFTLFRIDESRGSGVLVETLGTEFAGVIGCDYFSAYRKYLTLNEQAQVQFCWAHLIRDVRFLVEHPDARNRAYGQRVLETLHAVFTLLHRRDEFADQDAFRIVLDDQARAVWTQATFRTPATREARNLAQRFHQHGHQYLQFLTTPEMEPTNNLAEQAIRFVVLDHKVTQGTRGPAGRRWCERVWTTLATCRQTGRDVFPFLFESIQDSNNPYFPARKCRIP